MSVEQQTFFEPPQITDQQSYAQAWRHAEHIFSLVPDEDPLSEAWHKALCEAEIKFGLVDDREMLRHWRRIAP